MMNEDNRTINNFDNSFNNNFDGSSEFNSNNGYNSENNSSNLDYQSNSVNIMPEVNNIQSNSLNNTVLYDTSSNINDRQIQTKKKKATIKINQELKTAFLLMIILLVCMAFIPTIFDWLNELKIKIFG